MPTKERPELARTDTDSLLRHALERCVQAPEFLTGRWATADPIDRGRMKGSMERAQKILQAVPDPKPGQCAHIWHDALDNVWDRCGQPAGHADGEHLAEYMMTTREGEALGPSEARAMALLRGFLSGLPIDHQDRFGVVRSIQVLRNASPAHDCDSCGSTDEACRSRLTNSGRPCCGACHLNDTHGALRSNRAEGTGGDRDG